MTFINNKAATFIYEVPTVKCYLFILQIPSNYLTLSTSLSTTYKLLSTQYIICTIKEKVITICYQVLTIQFTNAFQLSSTNLVITVKLAVNLKLPANCQILTMNCYFSINWQVQTIEFQRSIVKYLLCHSNYPRTIMY